MILQKLREETAAIHAQLENTELLSQFRTKSINLETYNLILKKFFHFFSCLEVQTNKFENLENYLPDYGQRRKAEMIANDLRILGISPENLIKPELPNLAALGHAFGSLYVLEGSTLGGKIISSIIYETLNIKPETGGSYFYGYGAETGLRWKNFCAALERFSEEHKQDDQIVSGASDTFLKLKNWLEA